MNSRLNIALATILLTLAGLSSILLGALDIDLLSDLLSGEPRGVFFDHSSVPIGTDAFVLSFHLLLTAVLLFFGILYSFRYRYVAVSLFSAGTIVLHLLLLVYVLVTTVGGP